MTREERIEIYHRAAGRLATSIMPGGMCHSSGIGSQAFLKLPEAKALAPGLDEIHPAEHRWGHDGCFWYGTAEGSYSDPDHLSQPEHAACRLVALAFMITLAEEASE